MSKSVIKKLNRQTKSTPPPLTQPMGSAELWAGDWDSPKTQQDRVLTKAQQPRLIGKGPSGIERKR